MAGTGVNMDPAAPDQDQIDLLKIGLAAYPNRNALQAALEIHDFPILRQWFGENRARLQSGHSIVDHIMLDENGTARFIQPYQEDETAVPDVMATIQVPWRLINANYSFEIGEIDANRSESKLVDLIKVRREPANLSMAYALESQCWLCPDTTADKENPYGIPYYLPPITGAQVTAQAADDTVTRHRGQNPVAVDTNSFSDCAGIDASDSKYAMWRAYNDVWSNANATINEDDVKTLTRMHTHLHFRTPPNAKAIESGRYDKYQGYCCYPILEGMEEKARANNDSLGRDLGMYSGSVVVKGTPFQWVDALDSVSSNPAFLVNHYFFYPYVMKGDYFRESGPRWRDRQHRVAVVHIDLKFNFAVTNRRACGGRIDYVAAA